MSTRYLTVLHGWQKPPGMDPAGTATTLEVAPTEYLTVLHGWPKPPGMEPAGTATTFEVDPTDTHRTYLIPRVLPGG